MPPPAPEPTLVATAPPPPVATTPIATAPIVTAPIATAPPPTHTHALVPPLVPVAAAVAATPTLATTEPIATAPTPPLDPIAPPPLIPAAPPLPNPAAPAATAPAATAPTATAPTATAPAATAPAATAPIATAPIATAPTLPLDPIAPPPLIPAAPPLPNPAAPVATAPAATAPVADGTVATAPANAPAQALADMLCSSCSEDDEPMAATDVVSGAVGGAVPRDADAISCIGNDEVAAEAVACQGRRPRPLWAGQPRCKGGCGDVSCDQGMVSASDAEAAVKQAAALAAAATHATLTAEHAIELKAARDETAAATQLAINESIGGLLGDLINRLEAQACEAQLRTELTASRRALADAKDAAGALAKTVNALRQQIGGGNWLSALGKQAEKAAQAEKALKKSEAKRQRAEEMCEFGPQMLASGKLLASQLISDASARTAALHDELAAPPPTSAAEVGLSDRRVDQLACHLEEQLFGAGGGSISRTRLLAAALLQRPAVRRALAKQSETCAEKLARTALAMLDHVKQTLRQLSTGKRGSRSADDHMRFESLVAALVPDDATDEKMMRTIGELLGLHWEQIDRAQKRQLANDGTRGGHSRSTKISRKKRKDWNGVGRLLCRSYWHSDATRFDTNARKKRRWRIGVKRYVEHWRRIQYDTNQQMLDAFYASPEYKQYIEAGGKPISSSIFFQEKCKCVVKADNEECACPLCTQMYELLRDWHRQRKVWHAEASTSCTCGACAEGSSYRKASESTHCLNEFLLCGHETFPSLQLPGSSEEVKLRRRQCCRVPLLASHNGGRPSNRTLCKDVCDACGWERRMPVCPIENSAAHPAEWKEYRQRGPASSGMGNQEDLVVVPGTRTEMMAQLKKIYELWLPHYWIKRWCEHQRQLTYATLADDEACLMTDFSAVYDHKAFASKCCEQPHHSNMDVFVVTYVAYEGSERKKVTEVVRAISEEKGNAHFHNAALKLITQYLKTKVPSLARVFVFTDGCKGQYKGRKNFGRIAQFPSQHDGVRLHHRFSASHHFKGPHDAFGKDFKLLSRTAERNKKRRMPYTHDWYAFGAEVMAQPMKRARTMRQVVDELPATDGTPTTVSRKRTKRQRTIVEMDPGQEAAGREARMRIESSSEQHGLFSPTAYHWLFFASPAPGLKVVPWGQVCKPGECHAILDPTEEGDANEVKGTDSMYEFAGINPCVTEGELFTKCFPCHCKACRVPSSVSVEYDACPNRAQTGGWQRDACHRTRGLVERAAKKRNDYVAFAKQIRASHKAGKFLFAAAGDPKQLERGGRPYWLLRICSAPYNSRTKLKAWDHPKATTIPAKTWVVRAQWYLSTAEDHRAKRQGYKLLPEKVLVKVSTIIQELDLDFQHEGRAGTAAESVLSDEAHDRIMGHNFATYT